jgi:hypothetical protein
MSITSDYTGIKNYKDVCWIEDDKGKRRLNPVTYALVVPFSMHIGMHEITEKNADEWFARIRLVEAVYGGGLLMKDGKTVGLTVEDIHAHIGLRLTGTMSYTRAQFMRHLSTELMPELSRQYKANVKMIEDERAAA